MIIYRDGGPNGITKGVIYLAGRNLVAKVLPMNPAVFEVLILDGQQTVEKLTFASPSAKDTATWVRELNRCFGVAGKGTAAGSAAAGSGDMVSLLLAKKTMNADDVMKVR